MTAKRRKRQPDCLARQVDFPADGQILVDADQDSVLHGDDAEIAYVRPDQVSQIVEPSFAFEPFPLLIHQDKVTGFCADQQRVGFFCQVHGHDTFGIDIVLNNLRWIAKAVLQKRMFH